MKVYKNNDEPLPCYSCKYNTYEGENCFDCVNDKGTVFRKWEKMEASK